MNTKYLEIRIEMYVVILNLIYKDIYICYIYTKPQIYVY